MCPQRAARSQEPVALYLQRHYLVPGAGRSGWYVNQSRAIQILMREGVVTSRTVVLHTVWYRLYGRHGTGGH